NGGLDSVTCIQSVLQSDGHIDAARISGCLEIRRSWRESRIEHISKTWIRSVHGQPRSGRSAESRPERPKGLPDVLEHRGRRLPAEGRPKRLRARFLVSRYQMAKSCGATKLRKTHVRSSPREPTIDQIASWQRHAVSSQR